MNNEGGGENLPQPQHQYEFRSAHIVDSNRNFHQSERSYEPIRPALMSVGAPKKKNIRYELFILRCE